MRDSLKTFQRSGCVLWSENLRVTANEFAWCSWSTVQSTLRTDVCFGFLRQFKSLCRGGGHIKSCARSSTSTAHNIGESLSVDFAPGL
jgi:hypothetical protein